MNIISISMKAASLLAFASLSTGAYVLSAEDSQNDPVRQEIVSVDAKDSGGLAVSAEANADEKRKRIVLDRNRTASNKRIVLKADYKPLIGSIPKKSQDALAVPLSIGLTEVDFTMAASFLGMAGTQVKYSDNFAESRSDQKFTFKAEEMTLREVLDYFCAQGKFHYSVQLMDDGKTLVTMGTRKELQGQLIKKKTSSSSDKNNSSGKAGISF